MSFKRLDPEDFLISAESITAGAWTGDSAEQTEFFKDATQESSDSGDYYLSIYNSSDSSTREVQFNVAYGNSDGSGSAPFNSNIAGKSPTSTIYGQFQNIVLGDENKNFTFGDKTHTDFYALTIDRARFKGSLLPGTMTLELTSGSNAAGTRLSLTDNSANVSSVTFNEAGRVFQIVSGAAGTVHTATQDEGYHPDSGSYGLFLPDIGTILLNAAALDTDQADGGIAINTGRSSADDDNNDKLFLAISGAASFTLNSKETLTSDFAFIRARNSEFNYSANPSFSSGSVGDVTFTEFINAPQTFITTVGLYNDENELLATAKLSKPLKKDFTKEALIRVKLDF
jgi:hypothetical protein